VIWITFLGAALAWQQHRHIAVGVLVDALPAAFGRLVRIAACVLVIAFMMALVKVGLDYLDTQWRQRSASLRLSMARIYIVIPLSAALMAWFALSDLLRLLAGKDVAAQGGTGQ
jgi:TRAP-type C4-dicarboxylate transport system permease small subunit